MNEPQPKLPALHVVQDGPPDPAQFGGSADLNLRILHPLLNYVREHSGSRVLSTLLASAGLEEGQLRGSLWISWEQFERLLQGARETVPDDETFVEACAYQFERGYGPLRFLIRAMTPRKVYELSALAAPTIVHIGKLEVQVVGSNAVVCHYTSTKPESRLMCLSRVAQMTAMPTMWGLPPAHVESRQCIANGDPACEYHVLFYTERRWLPMLAGLAAGSLAALATVQSGGLGQFSWMGLPVLGATLGYAWELRRINRLNLDHGSEINDALRELAAADADARRELIALHQRQKEWTRLLEERATDRAERTDELAGRLQEVEETRHQALRGVSHDLNNPLQLLRIEPELLSELERADPEYARILDAHREAVERIENLLRDLMQVATSESGLVSLSPERLDVRQLADRLRARLQALVFKKDMRVSVFSNREAPDFIHTDRVVFDRVVDNLLTNASKYTEQGSIVVELDGRPGYLTVKVSDTGPGIAAEGLRKIFEPRRGPVRGHGRGYGMGLSVVVQLMDQLGGNLEVMSRPDEGTTFWAHFPVEPNGAGPDRGGKDLVERVVTIRKAPG